MTEINRNVQFELLSVTGQVCHQAYLPTQLTTLRKNEYGPLRIGIEVRSLEVKA